MTVTINGSGTMTGLAVGGLNDNIITKNEMATGGAWAPAGTVLQVVHGTGATDPETATTSTSFVATGTYASITPSSSTSKILVIMTGGLLYMPSSGTSMQATIYRNGTTNLGSTGGLVSILSNAASLQVPVSMSVLDSPATTSSTEYRAYIKVPSGNTGQLNNHEDQCVHVTLMEIAA